jgi:hypothetical protein
MSFQQRREDAWIIALVPPVLSLVLSSQVWGLRKAIISTFALHCHPFQERLALLCVGVPIVVSANSLVAAWGHLSLTSAEQRKLSNLFVVGSLGCLGYVAMQSRVGGEFLVATSIVVITRALAK